MSLSRFIPKRVFQVIAFLLLAGCLALTAYWIITDSGLFHIIARALDRSQRGLAMLLTFLCLFPIWVVVVLPIRALSQMPTLQEELGQEVTGLPSLVSGMKRLYETEQAKNEEMYRASSYTPEMTRRARMLGWAFVLVGLGAAVIVAVTLSITLQKGAVFSFQVVLALIAVALFIAGLIQLITGKSVIRK